MGVGTERGSKITSGVGFKTDREGNTVVSKLNPIALKTLADKTGGQYFEINDSKNDVSRLINTIGQIEGELRDTRFVDVSSNRYYYFLLIALVLIIIDAMVSMKTIEI